MRKTIPVFVLLFILSLPFVFAVGYWDYLTKGLADTLYCGIGGCVMEGDIDMGGYNIINATWVNLTYANASSLCLNETCITNWGETNTTDLSQYSTTNDIWINISSVDGNDTVSSAELDSVCGTDGKILKRSGGTWQCATDQTVIGNYFNYTKTVEGDKVTLTINIP